MRKRLSLGVALLGIVLLGACSVGDALGPGQDSVSGTYELVTVNGRRLPAVLYQEPGYRLEVLNANFTFSRDGTFSEAGIVREIVNGSANTSSSSTNGYYEYRNGEVTFQDNTGRTYYGSVDRNTLRVVDDGVTLIYERY
ncbi:MAG: hypothetical protein WKF55_01040 [Gemmatimonadaceae bacterium]